MATRYTPEELPKALTLLHISLLTWIKLDELGTSADEISETHRFGSRLQPDIANYRRGHADYS